MSGFALEAGGEDQAFEADERGLDAVAPGLDDQRDEQAGQGDGEAGLGGDERLLHAGGDLLHAGRALAMGESGEHGEHAHHGAQQTGQRRGGDQRVDHQQAAVDGGQQVEADLVEAAADDLDGELRSVQRRSGAPRRCGRRRATGSGSIPPSGAASLSLRLPRFT